MTSEQRIIYITGRGGDANKGLGAYLKTIDPHRIGLSVNSIFLSLPFEQQISTIHDLLHRFDGPNTSIIANSYGAYLLTSAFIDKPAISSHVLLLSPALGLTLAEEEMFYSRPPNQRSWSEALEQGRMTKPSYLAVCAGELDGGSCSPIMVRQFSELIKADQVQLIPEQGHQLARTVVQSVVGLFLTPSD
jgi:pimeloyl-ACP methyl ester carboxylesterase